VRISQGSERCTDFASKFIRLPSGGKFSVKVVAVKRNMNHSLSVTPMGPHGKHTRNTAGKPVAPLSFADSFRERREWVARHPYRNPDHNPDHKKPGRSQSPSFHILRNDLL